MFGSFRPTVSILLTLPTVQKPSRTPCTAGFPADAAERAVSKLLAPWPLRWKKCGIPHTPICGHQTVGKMMNYPLVVTYFRTHLDLFQQKTQLRFWTMICLFKPQFNVELSWTYVFQHDWGLKSWRCGSVSLKHLQNPKDQCYRNAQRTCLNLKLYI